MKKYIGFLFLLFLGFNLNAQTFSKGTGIGYFDDAPNVTPDTTNGTELAFSVARKILYRWDRDSSAWLPVDKTAHNTLTTDSLTGSTYTANFLSVQNHIFQLDMTSAGATVTMTLGNPVTAGVYTFDFTDIATTQDITWPSTVKDLNRVDLGTVTYEGPSVQTFYYDGTNYVAIPQPEPAISFASDSITTTTLTIDLEYKRQRVVEVDMASATSVTLTVNNPFFGASETGVYTFHFYGVSGTDNVTWPSDFYDMNNTALGTDALTAGTAYTCYYNPDRSKYFCK